MVDYVGLEAFICAAEFRTLELFQLKFWLIPALVLPFWLRYHLVTHAGHVRYESVHFLVPDGAELLYLVDVIEHGALGLARLWNQAQRVRVTIDPGPVGMVGQVHLR